jgi:glycosyltransferase involved in cell wall biosynthesis
MKIALSTIGKFHTFDLARELHSRDVLADIFTGYPRFKLRNEGLPQSLIHTFPWMRAPFMAFPWKHHLPHSVLKEWDYYTSVTFGAWVAKNLPECDIYVGLSGSSLDSGKKVKQLGSHYICDRGSSHIRIQNQLLLEEHDKWNTPFLGIDPRTIEKEEQEYDESDMITVPSNFVLRSFIDQGVPAKKLSLLPYGVNLSQFQPVGKPAHDSFDVLFVGGMSLRKGVQYLVQAYQKLSHPAKTLTFVGSSSPELIEVLKSKNLWPSDAKVKGHVPQAELKQIMSRSHVMVLPSIEEGLAMVQAQAMACGCPVIGTLHTGAENLYTHEKEGFILPIREVDALTERLQWLADHPDERAAMGKRALAHVQGMGGWRDYGDKAIAVYQTLVDK